MRKWKPRNVPDDWRGVLQIVAPTAYRGKMLRVAHDAAAGHLGVTKTYDRILRHFYWPGLKKEVRHFCKTCHICQLIGKPNQKIPPAPLYPIPVLKEAWLSESNPRTVLHHVCDIRSRLFTARET